MSKIVLSMRANMNLTAAAFLRRLLAEVTYGQSAVLLFTCCCSILNSYFIGN